eukprot:10430302-Lingulodinium_polyedra.AAC.1
MSRREGIGCNAQECCGLVEDGCHHEETARRPDSSSSWMQTWTPAVQPSQSRSSRSACRDRTDSPFPLCTRCPG